MAVPGTEPQPPGVSAGPGQPASASPPATVRPVPVHRSEERKVPGGAIWLLLVPLLCCAGPLILVGLVGLAAAGATLGTVGGVLGGLGLAVGAAWWVRRRRRSGAACWPPASGAGRR